jgi:hypothetical protein
VVAGAERVDPAKGAAVSKARVANKAPPIHPAGPVSKNRAAAGEVAEVYLAARAA